MMAKERVAPRHHRCSKHSSEHFIVAELLVTCDKLLPILARGEAWACQRELGKLSQPGVPSVRVPGWNVQVGQKPENEFGCS